MATLILTGRNGEQTEYWIRHVGTSSSIGGHIETLRLYDPSDTSLHVDTRRVRIISVDDNPNALTGQLERIVYGTDLGSVGRPQPIEFTEPEADILALGWHEAILISRVPDCPVTTDHIVLLDTLTHRVGEVLLDTVTQSIDALTQCQSFASRYRIEARPQTDSPEALEQIYPMQQNSQLLDRRFNDAIHLLLTKRRTQD